jgi:YfiH family protein
MPFISCGEIRYYVFETLNHPGVTHAIFTRQGGLSKTPWKSLNMGGLVGDEQDRVEMNRRLAFQAVGRDPMSMYDVWQIHSSRVLCIDSPRNPQMPHQKADAILTNNPDVTLFMRFADCVPILLYDTVQKVVGLVHAGWQGTLKRIAVSAVQELVRNYGSNLDDIWAGIGPSICVDHYEVGTDVIQRVREVFKDEWIWFLRDENQSVKFDLQETNLYLLKQAGINQIEISDICTVCQKNDWYSHRGENGKTGRFGVLIGLNSYG